MTVVRRVCRMYEARDEAAGCHFMEAIRRLPSSAPRAAATAAKKQSPAEGWYVGRLCGSKRRKGKPRRGGLTRARQGPGAVAGRPGRPHCAGSEGNQLLEKKNPSQKGVWQGQVLGALVRESVIHETLARAFRPNGARESTAPPRTQPRRCARPKRRHVLQRAPPDAAHHYVGSSGSINVGSSAGALGRARRTSSIRTELCAASHLGGPLACKKTLRGGFDQGEEEVGVCLPVTAAPSSLGSTVRARMWTALPLIGLRLAMIVNAAWIGFLGYFVLKLIWRA